MARTRSEFLGAFGTAFQIFKAIADAVMAEGGTDEDLRKVIQPGDLAKHLALIVTGKAKIVIPESAGSAS